MNARLSSRAVLLLGLAILVAGILLALRRGDGSTTVNEAVLRARLDSAERRIAAQPPRLDIALAQIGTISYKAAIAGSADNDALLRFDAVRTQVTERLQAEQPALTPDIRALLRRAAPRDTRLADYSRMFQQARLLKESSTVVGLLLSRRDAGGAGTLRLEVYQLSLRDFREVFDPTELLPASTSDFGIDIEDPPSDVVQTRVVWLEWPSDPAGGQQFVPLYLLHEFAVPEEPENAGVVNRLGEPIWLQIATDVVLVPHRLFFRRDDGTDIEIDIRDVLRSPLVLSSPAPGG